jgi:4-amino-4-deoxy-L-arabinose transferase-like glycosyltransferase
MTRLRRETFLALVFAAAFLARLLLVLALRDVTAGPGVSGTDDDVEFNNLALRLARGEGYVKYDHGEAQATAFRAPGWPIFLAGLYAVAGPRPWVVYVACCALGALTCALTYLLAREVVGEALARVAAALAVVYLPHAWFATLFYSENLFVPLLALGLWLFLRYLHGGPAWLPAAAGLVLGAAVLARPYALLLAPVLLAVLAYARRAPAPALRARFPVAALLLLAAMAAVVAPWTARNYRAFGRVVLVATNGGSTFYGGNNDRVVSIAEPRLLGSWLSTTELPHRDLVEAAPNEVDHDKVEWELGLRWAGAHPGKALLSVPLKLGRLLLWLPDFDAGGPAFYAARAAGYLPFLTLALAGAVACLRRRAWSPAWLALHGTLLATALTAVIFWGSPRFRDANAPLLMVYAAVGLTALRPRAPRPEEAVAPGWAPTPEREVHDAVLNV